MERLSDILKKIMLCLFMLLMAATLLFGVFREGHKSYIAAFLAALICAGIYLLLRRKLGSREQLLCERLGAVKTGAILAALCLVINLVSVLLLRAEPEIDYFTFWKAAVDLSRGEIPSAHRYLSVFPHIMGYSSFLSVFLRIFGESYFVPALLNVLLSVSSGIIIYALCLDYRGVRTASLAFLLWCFMPCKTIFNSAVFSEPLYTCLFLLFILLLSRMERRIETGRCKLAPVLITAVLSGLILAVGNAARPIAAVPIIAFFIWLLFLRGDRERLGLQWVRWAAFSLVLVLVYSVCGSLWRSHLEKALGEEPSSTVGYSIYVGFNPDTLGTYSNEDMALFDEYIYDFSLSPQQAQEHMMEHAKKRITSGEIDFPSLFANKIRMFMGDDQTGAFYMKKWMSGTAYSLLSVLSNITYYFAILLTFLGAVSLWRDPSNRSILTVPMYILGLTLAQMLVEVAARYHYSIVTMLVIIAALSAKEPAASK